MKNEDFLELVKEGNIVVIDNEVIAICKIWKPKYHNLFVYLYYRKNEDSLMLFSHFTLTKFNNKKIRLANKRERLMLFEVMFEHGIFVNKKAHTIVGNIFNNLWK